MSDITLSRTKPRNFVFSGTMRHDYKLLEVSEDVLKELSQNGVVIKGAGTEEAVLCTEAKTYALKYVETTNCLLLVPPCADDENAFKSQASPSGRPPLQATTVQQPGLLTQLQQDAAGSHEQPPVVARAMAKAHIEVVEVRPKLEVLEQLVRERPYPQPSEEEEGDEEEEEGGGASASGQPLGYTLEELLDRVQGARLQVQEALLEIGAVQLEGRWRTLRREHISHLLQMIILTAAQLEWPLAALPIADMVRELVTVGCNATVAEHCLRQFSAPGAPASTAGGAQAAGDGPAAMEEDTPPGTCCLDEKKVCRHFAQQLLKQRTWSVHEFHAAWAEACPRGLVPEASMLQGLALVDEDAVHLFSVEDLPRDPQARFAALFKRRVRWEWGDLEPYLRDIKVPGESGEALLLKYARGSQARPDAPLYYTAR